MSKPQATDLGLHHHGAGDENRTRALSLGSCGHLGLVRALTWGNGRIVASSGWVDFPAIPRCSPLDLVRLWCGRATGHRGPEIGVRWGRGGRHPETMSRWKLYDNWFADLVGSSVEQLRERRAFAAERAEGAVARGMGRNPKAAQEWRERLRAVDDELLKRGIQGA
jgi:hypothetical protein